jgi:hypothetical protein
MKTPSKPYKPKDSKPPKKIKPAPKPGKKC